MAEFIVRLKQRKLVQWALAYVAAAFALIQVADVVASQFGWPDSLRRGITLAITVGFVVTLVIAWYHGEKGRQRVSGAELLLIALVLAVGGALVWQFGRVAPTAQDTETVAGATPSGLRDAALPIRTAPVPAKSIAVLPFVNMSGDPGNEYFSDGMSEEILNALAQVNDLKVAGRTSSFYYKGRNQDLRTIGRALGVANILEGSVRKQGNEVRITAQLIRVSDDTHLWSRAYDGNLSDVFRLQEDIARAITDQLKVVLVGAQKTSLVPVATTNTEAYTLYLKASDALNRRDYKAMGDAIGWLQQAIRLDPDFARAHSRLAMIHVLGQAEYGASLSEVESNARAALALDPTDGESQVALGLLARHQRSFIESRAALDRALALAPNDASVHLYAAQNLIDTGYTREGIAQLDRALTIDPLLPNALYWRGQQYLHVGDSDSAERLFEKADGLGLSFAVFGRSAVARARGDFARVRALSLPLIVSTASNVGCPRNPAVDTPVYLDGVLGGDAEARNKAVAVLDACLDDKPVTVPMIVPFGLIHLGQPARALVVTGQGPTSDDAGFFMDFWGPAGRDARRLPQFAQFARKLGFAALWDKYGPPDLCRKNAVGDYVCQ
ncbi:MAG TPA: tetratricopeptide repeat protein [Rhodanobacteraceae bacterium]|nr:tetratricopeptide repeat protein [Rhodanobacteraceae bacterium]